MNRVIFLAFTFLMVLLLSSCSNSSTPDFSAETAQAHADSAVYRDENVQTDSHSVTSAEEVIHSDQAAFDTAAYDYADSDVGIICILGSDWHSEDDASLRCINDNLKDDLESQFGGPSSSFVPDIEYKLIAYQPTHPYPANAGSDQSAMEPYSTDMNQSVSQPVASDVASSVSVYSEDLACINGLALSEEGYISARIGDDNSILESLGIEYGTVEHIQAEIAGQTHAALAISGTINGVPYYQLRIICKPAKMYRYMTVFTAESYAANNTVQIIERVFRAMD